MVWILSSRAHIHLFKLASASSLIEASMHHLGIATNLNTSIKVGPLVLVWSTLSDFLAIESTSDISVHHI